MITLLFRSSKYSILQRNVLEKELRKLQRKASTLGFWWMPLDFMALVWSPFGTGIPLFTLLMWGLKNKTAEAKTA